MRSPWFGKLAFLFMKSALLHVSVATLSGVVLFLIIDFVEVGNLAVDLVTSADLAKLALLNIPSVTRQILPVSFALGCLTAVGSAVRRGEVGAVFSAGGSPAVIMKPLFIVGLLIVLLESLMIETILPRTQPALMALRHRLRLKDSKIEQFRPNSWFKGKELLYQTRVLAKPDGSAFREVLILKIDNGHLVDRWDVAQLRYENERWLGSDIRHMRFSDPKVSDAPPLIEEIASAELPIIERPEDFLIGLAPPSQLFARDLLKATHARERLGRSAAEHRLELYRRICDPLALLFSSILAVLIALRLGRKQSLAAAMGMGSAIGFGLWIAGEIARLLAHTHTMQPVFASLLAPALLLAITSFAFFDAWNRGIADRKM